jgi:predicted AlkP superfamily phosphohydrolase/phosphomutase
VPRPVFIVGLDGATFDVLRPLIDAGDLPVLGGLVAAGAHGILESVIPPITPTAWSSFLTGKEPGKHGIYDFHVFDPRLRRTSFITSRALREDTVWELLTRAGRRVAVVNLPMMFPPRAGSGTVVSGFDTPSTSAPFTHPLELRDEILARYPDYRFVATPPPDDENMVRPGSLEAFASCAERSIDQRAGVAQELLARGPWDAFMLHVQDTDALQHRVWRFLAQPDRYPEQWERLRRVYRRLDTHLGTLLAARAPDALTLVLSDHGFGPYVGCVYPNVLLERWGYLAWRGRTRTRLARSIRKRLAALGLQRATPTRNASWIARSRARTLERAVPLRWRRTRAYVPISDIYGQLFLNLRGREPDGIVEPGAASAALREEIRARLLAERDPQTGLPVFADVARGEEVYRDDTLGRRPDLVLIPAPGLAVSRGLNLRRWLDRYALLSGTHRPEGILIASGEGIRPGPLSRPARITDLAPTILAACGLPVPDDMDGRVLTELFEIPPEVRTTAGTGARAGDDAVLTDEEEAQVGDRLRALGYLE